MKQTVEDASAKAMRSFKIDDNYDDHAYAEGHHNGFLRGAAWQKEQGIDWTPISQLPPLTQSTGFSEFIPLPNTILLLYQNGLAPTPGSVISFPDGEVQWHPAYGHWQPTHWCIINLPK